jgi:hypothetical protein
VHRFEDDHEYVIDGQTVLWSAFDNGFKSYNDRDEEENE